MPEPLDEQIRSLVVELVESSPPPRPASTVLDGVSSRPVVVPLGSGLVRMGLVATAVLLVGLAGAWIGRNLPPPVDVAAAPVVDGSPAPEPAFSTDSFGEEVRLLPSTGDVRPDVDPGTLDGAVVAVGRIEDTDVEVFAWVTTDVVNGRCLQMIGSGLRESVCSGGIELTEFDVPRARARFDQTSREPIDVLAVWRVPDGTSIVRVGIDGEVISWQRPVAGVAAFTFDPNILLVMLDALDDEGDPIRSAGFSPYRAVNPLDDEEPPDSSVEGAEEDLVDLAESHPAVLLLAAGATSQQAFADAATEGDLNFVCGAGGGIPAWELCLVAADGALAVVPFDSEPGLVARISQAHLVTDVLVPLDTDQPVGIRYVGSQATADIEYLGLSIIGRMSAPSPDQDGRHLPPDTP